MWWEMGVEWCVKKRILMVVVMLSACGRGDVRCSSFLSISISLCATTTITITPINPHPPTHPSPLSVFGPRGPSSVRPVHGLRPGSCRVPTAKGGGTSWACMNDGCCCCRRQEFLEPNSFDVLVIYNCHHHRYHRHHYLLSLSP